MTELRQITIAFVAGLALAAAAILSVGCATGCGATGSTEPVVRSALDAFALATEPVWDATNEACAAKQEAVSSEVEAKRLTPDEGDAKNRETRARCKQLTAIFQALRAAQGEAADLVEAGRLKEAEEWLLKLQDQWRELRALSAGQPDGGA